MLDRCIRCSKNTPEPVRVGLQKDFDAFKMLNYIDTDNLYRPNKAFHIYVVLPLPKGDDYYNPFVSLH